MNLSCAVIQAIVLLPGSVLAADELECELKADVAWMEQSKFEQRIRDMGYTIKQLVVSEGNCYQLTGENKDGKAVLAFFNPQSGELVQENLVQ